MAGPGGGADGGAGVGRSEVRAFSYTPVHAAAGMPREDARSEARSFSYTPTPAAAGVPRDDARSEARPFSYTPVLVAAGGRREDYGKRDADSKRSEPSRHTSPAAAAAVVPRLEGVFTALEAGHAKSVHSLARRLRSARALRSAWASGDAEALVLALEASRDEALAFGAFQLMQQHAQPLPPRSLARLLPLAQHAAQSDCEDHAVAAMRFVLHALQVSWPAIAKALRHVATPKATLDACEEAASRLSALLAIVRAMAKSVRVSRTSGPLVPVCRKLKISLEEALVAAGRCRAG